MTIEEETPSGIFDGVLRVYRLDESEVQGIGVNFNQKVNLEQDPRFAHLSVVRRFIQWARDRGGE